MSDLSSRTTGDFDPHPVPGGPPGEPGLMGDSALQLMHDRLLREKEEPTEGFSLTPIFLIFLLAGLIFWSGLYVINNCAGFYATAYDPSFNPLHPPPPPPVDPMKAGQAIFLAQCKQCHGAEGLGAAGTYPPLAGSPWPVGDPDRAIKIILYGMGGPITVEGSTYNSQQMPNVGDKLKDDQIAYVLTYVRASFGNHADPVDPGEVAAVRAELGKRGPWTPEELLAHHPLEAPKPATPEAGAPATAPAP